MRVFHIVVALAGLLAVTSALPQYGYQQPLATGSSRLSGLGSPLQSASHRGGDKYLPPATTTEAPIINKKFYLISAPEDQDNIGKTKHLVLGRPQRNYRVVFIKAPGSDNANVKYSAEFAPQEEKTVIYVLSKKDNDLDVGDIATPAPTQPSKPEVFFIKYKTPEEAEAAQKEIQGQYDKLGGTNEFSDEGTAPVTSVIGSLDGLNPDGSYNYKQINGNGNGNGGHSHGSDQLSPSIQYLPSGYQK